jgi:hypothetical protein
MRPYRHINKDGLMLTFIDMMIAMHGNFFLMNPLSTMTWPVFIVRSILGMKSAPEVSFVSESGTIYLWFNNAGPYAEKGWLDFRKMFGLGGNCLLKVT